MDYIDLTDPSVRARVEYLGREAEQNIERALVAKYPELLNVDLKTDIKNREAVYAVLNQNGLPLTAENLEWSLQKAYEAGQIVLPMYSAAEEQAFPRMTTAQMREYLEKTRQAPAPANAAEFLLTAGGRAKDTVMSRGQR